MGTKKASEWWGKAATKVLHEKNYQEEVNNTNLQLVFTELKACGRTRNLKRGKQIHAQCKNSSIYVVNALINMYAKCGSMVDAHLLFDSLKHPTVVSWTALILGYADNGQGHTALDLFCRMRAEGPEPDWVTFVAALKACTSLAVKGHSRWVECRERGKEIHYFIVQNGFSSDVYVLSSLVDMYAKCGIMEDAQRVFDSLKCPTVVSWTTLIMGYADNGQGRAALNLFNRMRAEGPAPDSVTYVAALKACTSVAVKEGSSQWVECRNMGKEVHNLALQSGFSSDIFVQSTLVDMYAKCGKMADARRVFDSLNHPTVVPWTALILGYADNGEGHTALDLFNKMRAEGPAPDWVTFVAALKACISLAVKEGKTQWAECRDRGKEIHKFAVKKGCSSDINVQSSLVDMYAKCGSMENAREVFESMKHPDVVSWTALILGYAHNGQGHTALDLFIEMRTVGPPPDFVILGAALKACGLVGALEFGRTIHSEIDCDLDVVLLNCLVDFYAKCGSLVEAQRVFDLHAETRDMITWTTLLAGFSSCGDSETVFGLFEGMQDAGFQPDGITFLCILICCSHVGLVEKGKECFDTMLTRYRVIPSIEHYNCMLDIFGRANRLDEAMVLLDRMPCSPNDVTWTIILSACWKWKNVEMGKMAFQSLIKLNAKDPVAYVLMGQIYKSKGMLKEQELVMGKLNVWKMPGETSWTNEVGEVHKFLDDGNQHPQIREIRDKWDSMVVLMRKHADIPDLFSFDRKEAICGHSERFALVCALINTKPRQTISIVKNLRVCDDCHIAIALISKLVCKTIICRDASRIHEFKDGKCSCGDFW